MGFHSLPAIDCLAGPRLSAGGEFQPRHAGLPLTAFGNVTENSPPFLQVLPIATTVPADNNYLCS
jgi:hypothetical protein